MRVPSILAALVLAAVGTPLLAGQNATPAAVSAAQPAVGAPMRLTTTSEHARQLFGQAIVESGNYRLDECLKSLRAATAEDGGFAAAWALLAYYSTDPREAASALTEAQSLAGKMSPSEMLLVHWVTALEHNDQLAAISNLNDLVHREAGDKFVLYLAGRWFVDQHDAQRAIPLFEQVLVFDPEFTPVLNRLAYSYAAKGDLARAEAIMQHYVEAMPADPNPEDSYGDILLKAGRYLDAKSHFEAALRKDPGFGPSEHELGDVYALLGNQEGAREAYEKSARMAANPRRSLEYRSSIALSYVRENRYGFADREYTALAAEARQRKYADLEAAFHEAMAIYETDDAAALKQLDAAEAAIRDDHDLAAVTRDENMAVVRRWRALRSLHAGNPAMAQVCLEVLAEKYQLTENEWIGAQMHALRGALLMEEKKFAAAVAELELTGDDAFSLDLLARAKRQTGDAPGAEAAVRQLLSIHASTLDSVLVVEPARLRLAATSASN
jgi:tetratricopeptide (TPR) repeat protein